MLVESKSEFSGCDLESTEEVIRETLKEICLDSRVFNTTAILFSRYDTLFECKALPDAYKLGEIIVNEISIRLRDRLSSWCTVYVAPRINGETFYIPQLGISIVNKNDQTAWSKAVASNYETNGWSPETGEFQKEDNTIFSRLKYDYLFLVEEKGTQKGSQFASQLKLRKLFAVIYATISERQERPLVKCAADPYTLSLQLPCLASASLSITISSIGALLPYYIDEHLLTKEDILKIQRWFELAGSSNNENSNRIDKCSYFIHRAMNSIDIESYVNFFVALDALFGTRGAVEASITQGVQMLHGSHKWQEKIAWLFELRNELVHGGSRHLKEWHKYYNYYHHFDSKPNVDIEKLAFAALLRSPEILT